MATSAAAVNHPGQVKVAHILVEPKDEPMLDELGEQIAGLRRAVMEYHSSVVGHGMLINDLEARVRRVEQHLDLPSIDQH